MADDPTDDRDLARLDADDPDYADWICRQRATREQRIQDYRDFIVNYRERLPQPGREGLSAWLRFLRLRGSTFVS